jgi:hypothetical protein
MPVLVHLTDAKDGPTIQGSGLKGRSASFPGARLEDNVQLQHAVFAMPCLPNELATHQWVTELLARGVRAIIAVHFEADPHTRVWVGREYREHQQLSLANAIKLMQATPDLRGWEIIIPGDVPAHAIREMQEVPCTIVPPKGPQPLDPCEPGSYVPERLSPPVEPRLPI